MQLLAPANLTFPPSEIINASAVANYHFTKENAAHFARLSHAPNSARFLQPSPAPTPTQKLAEIANPEIERTRLRLERLGRMMDKTSDPRELDALSRAYERLFKAWMVLTATPGSGQRKPSSKRPPSLPSGDLGSIVQAEIPRAPDATKIDSQPDPTKLESPAGDSEPPVV